MRNDITLLDGAVETDIWEKAGSRFPTWLYNVKSPEIVEQLHRSYLEAGAQIILANTFGANAVNIRNSGYTVRQIVGSAMRIARKALGGRARIALSIGPLDGLLEPYGDISKETAFQIFDEQIGCGVENGPDLIYIQTFTDLEMLKIALRAASRHDIPIFCSMSFDRDGKTVMGNSVKDVVAGLKEFPVDAIGLNRSLGPDAAVPIIEEFSKNTDLPLIFKPDAGKSLVSNSETVREYNIESFVNDSLPALNYGVKYIGGYGGTNAAYIRRLRDKLAEHRA